MGRLEGLGRQRLTILTVRIKEEGNRKSFTNYCDIKFSNNWLTTELYCIRSHHEQVPGRPAAAEAPHWAAEVWGPDHPLQSVSVHWWPAEVLRRPHWGGLPHPGLQQAQREPLQGKRKLPNIVVGAVFSSKYLSMYPGSHLPDISAISTQLLY